MLALPMPGLRQAVGAGVRRWLWGACAAAGTALGCGPPPQAEAPRAATVLNGASGEPLGAEQLAAEVAVSGVVLATLDSRTCLTERGRRMETVVRPAALVRLVANVGGVGVTEFLGETAVPMRSEYSFHEGKLQRNYRVRHLQGSYRHRYDNGGPAFRKGKRAVPGEGLPHDLHSALAALREWRPRLGEEASLHAVLGRHLWKVDLAYRGPEMVTVAGQPRLSYRIDGQAERLAAPRVKPSHREFTVWLGDGADRVPLKIAAASRVGDVSLQLVQRATRGVVCERALSTDAAVRRKRTAR